MQSAACLRYGIKAFALHGINPKEKYSCADAIRLRQFHTCLRMIPCQSFGLDRKKTVQKRSFFLERITGDESVNS